MQPFQRALGFIKTCALKVRQALNRAKTQMTPKRRNCFDRAFPTKSPRIGVASSEGKFPVGSKAGRVVDLAPERSELHDMSDATAILNAIGQGEAKTAEQLLELVYDELRRLAAFKMAQEPPGQTLQPTALVHEAWLRLIAADGRQFQNRTHFFCAAAEAMRRILIDRARRKQSQRRGGHWEQVEVDGVELAAPSADDQLLAVHEALDKLALEHPPQAEVVKLRYFAGMTNEEVAQILNISVSTTKNYWIFARAWLFNEIESR
jgi:RNA polymerase sigma factor (TIGR02999 family)